MSNMASNHTIAKMAIGLAFVLGCARGSYLFGFPAGIAFGALLTTAAVMTWDAFVAKSPFAVLRRAIAICFLAFSSAVVIAPTWISPDFQYSIDEIANERKMQAELDEVFRSDERFSSLHPYFLHRKVTNVTLHGTLPDMHAVDDARTAIRNQCPTFCSRAHLSWNVRISESGNQFRTNEGRLDTDDSASPELWQAH